MAWKLEGATFVDGDGGLAYSVNLYERMEMSNGRVVMDRMGPLTEAQAAAEGFDLSQVLASLNTIALASLDAARDDAAAKATQIATLTGDLAAAAEQRDNLSGRLTEALAQVVAHQQDMERMQIEAAAQIAALEAECNELSAIVAEQASALNVQSNALVGAEEGAAA